MESHKPLGLLRLKIYSHLIFKRMRKYKYHASYTTVRRYMSGMMLIEHLYLPFYLLLKVEVPNPPYHSTYFETKHGQLGIQVVHVSSCRKAIEYPSLGYSIALPHFSGSCMFMIVPRHSVICMQLRICRQLATRMECSSSTIDTFAAMISECYTRGRNAASER